MTELQEINRKLDLIIDALGLSDRHRLSPIEVDSAAKSIVLQFQRKKNNATKHERKTG